MTIVDDAKNLASDCAWLVTLQEDEESGTGLCVRVVSFSWGSVEGDSEALELAKNGRSQEAARVLLAHGEEPVSDELYEWDMAALIGAEMLSKALIVQSVVMGREVFDAAVGEVVEQVSTRSLPKHQRERVKE